MHWVSYALILFGHTFFHVINSLKGAEIKMRKIKVLRYYKARVYIAKLNQDPIWIKVRKVNVLIIYYKALGQIHYIHKRNKNKCEKKLESSARALDPLKELNWNWELI